MYGSSRGRCFSVGGGCEPEAACVVRPLFWQRQSFWGVVGICLATILGLHLSWSGVCLLPKCRYGEKDCYFKVQVCFPASDDGCRTELRQRAIEGSSNHPVLGSEQLAIPLLAVLVSCVPALLAAVTVMVKRNIWLLDAGKYILGVTMCLLCIGIDILQNKTFDCRWWHDSHHGNAKACQKGLGLYVGGTLLIILSEMALLMLFTRMYERELQELKEMQVSCLTNSAISAINSEQYGRAVGFCSKAIGLDQSCATAYFRRGVAHAKMGNLLLAIDDLESVLVLQPRNDAVHFELERCQQLLEEGGDGGLGMGEVSEQFIDEEDGEEQDQRPLLPVKKVRFADKVDDRDSEDLLIGSVDDEWS